MTEQDERLDELRAAILENEYERGIKELENDPDFQDTVNRWAKKFTEEHLPNIETM
jgi:hypothetical protein